MQISSLNELQVDCLFKCVIIGLILDTEHDKLKSQ